MAANEVAVTLPLRVPNAPMVPAATPLPLAAPNCTSAVPIVVDGVVSGEVIVTVQSLGMGTPPPLRFCVQFSVSVCALPSES